MDGSGSKSRPLDLKPSIKPVDILHSDGKPKPMDESNNVLDPCMKGRTFFTLVHQGRAMGKGTGIHRQLRTGGIGDRSDMGMNIGRRVLRLLLLLLLASTFHFFFKPSPCSACCCSNLGSSLLHLTVLILLA